VFTLGTNVRKTENILQIKNSATETQHASFSTTGKPYNGQIPELIKF
jgi:hypothetical protein